MRAFIPTLTAAIALIALTLPGDAQIAFDFDTDGDPTTVANEVQADVGDLVVAFLIVTDYPGSIDFLQAIEFGLDATSGLRFLALDVLAPHAFVIHDGLEMIAIAFDPMPRSQMPMFIVRFIFQVLDPEPQVVSVVPTSSPLYENSIVYAGRTYGHILEVAVPFETVSQTRGYVNSGPPLPIEEVSWGFVKSRYAPDAVR